jgi:hypothetical protein
MLATIVIVTVHQRLALAKLRTDACLISELLGEPGRQPEAADRAVGERPSG